MTHPYENLPDNAFWRTAVARREGREFEALWQPKSPLKKGDVVASYGSCFAQHIGRALRARGLIWQQTEIAPHGLRADNRHAYGYDLFSSRTGNIYTTSMLLNWCNWAFADSPMPGEIWQGDDGYLDPMRPTLEPAGFVSEAEMLAARQTGISAFRQAVLGADHFVFTHGLTERWINSNTGIEYPMCPGVVGGRFDSSLHRFENMTFSKVKDALTQALDLMRCANPRLKFILTVSPVPLTATASGQHVLPATTQSKSVLRAVAGEIAATHDDVDYFPSFELITAPTLAGEFYARNKRSISQDGVRFVMGHFFRAHGLEARSPEPAPMDRVDPDVACDEELLDAFGATP